MSSLGCTDKKDTYVIVKYEWRLSKQMDGTSTAAYTIRHGKSVIDAECIGSKEGEKFDPLGCTPPLPVGKPMSMMPDGTQLVCPIAGREVYLEVISEEIRQ